MKIENKTERLATRFRETAKWNVKRTSGLLLYLKTTFINGDHFYILLYLC